MYNILTLNKIAAGGTAQFGEGYAVSDACEAPDGIVLRSFKMHDMALPESLKAVARAGAGVNNVPIDACTERGIVVFNTPGANANAVKELVLAGLFLSSRDVIGGIEWAKTLKDEGENVPALVEKGKGNFAGYEISGKTLAVVGLGAIGAMVANAAYRLGMNVVGFDPFLSVGAALHLDPHVKIAFSLEACVAEADYITIHVPLNDSTRGEFNAAVFGAMKKGVRFLNFARGELVDTAALAAALSDGTVSVYITDFPNADVLSLPGTISIPHLGASSEESEDNCAIMACRELIDYLENGNITNSVNLPDCELPKTGLPRITIIHKNVPAMISNFTTSLSDAGLNIENILNKSKKDMAYTMIETSAVPSEDAIAAIRNTDGVIRVRVL